MTVNFMGLTGPLGILPYSYTEFMLERMRAKDSSLQDFLDIFNHRMISFFYRAWEKYRFPVTYCLGDEDRFTKTTSWTCWAGYAAVCRIAKRCPMRPCCIM